MMDRIFSSLLMATTTLGLLYSGHKELLTGIICAISCTEIFNITERCKYSIEETLLAAIFTLSPFVIASYSMTVEHIVQVLIIVWFSDSGALIIGNLVGGPKFGSISPKKTYSGLIGGLSCGIFASQIVHYNDNIENIVLICIATQVGDILESAAKRLADIKDSNVYFKIPGHGGLLDRIDGLLLAMPVACAIYQK